MWNSSRGEREATYQLERFCPSGKVEGAALTVAAVEMGHEDVEITIIWFFFPNTRQHINICTLA